MQDSRQAAAPAPLPAPFPSLKALLPLRLALPPRTRMSCPEDRLVKLVASLRDFVGPHPTDVDLRRALIAASFDGARRPAAALPRSCSLCPCCACPFPRAVSRAADQYFAAQAAAPRPFAGIGPHKATVPPAPASPPPGLPAPTIDLTDENSMDGFAAVPPPAAPPLPPARLRKSAKSGHWVTLKPLTTAAFSTMKGDLPPEAYSTALDVWSEGGEGAKKALASFVASGAGKGRAYYKSQGGPGKARCVCVLLCIHVCMRLCMYVYFCVCIDVYTCLLFVSSVSPH